MEHHSSYWPARRFTLTWAVPLGGTVGDRQLLTPGPLMFRLCDIFPWLVTSTVYIPGRMAAADTVIEYSFSATCRTASPVWAGAAWALPVPVRVAGLPPPQPADNSATATAVAATTRTLGGEVRIPSSISAQPLIHPKTR